MYSPRGRNFDTRAHSWLRRSGLRVRAVTEAGQRRSVKMAHELIKMKRPLLFILIWVLALQVQAQPKSEIKNWFTPRGNGHFSAVAQSVCHKSSTESDGEIWSPDHMRKIVTRPSSEGDTTLFAIDENGQEFVVETGGWSCPEIGWSPTSALFFVTYSDGGAVGTYHVSAYRISAGSMKKIDLTSAAQRDFQRRYPRCFSPEEANITAVAWSADSTKLLVAAQVLPHSNCDNMGTFNLYKVAVSNGGIIGRIPQIAAKATVHDVLGPELRAAEDRCFTHPRSCRIPALHRIVNRKQRY